MQFIIKKYFIPTVLAVVGLSSKSTAQETFVDSTIMNPVKTEAITHIGYDKQPSLLVSSAISTVKGSTLSKTFATNLTNTFYGRIPGLTMIQGSGEAGVDAPQLFGRGRNTYNSGRNALVIVDGFESTMDQLSPDEVESVSFLKDASATAIYGSRGANGVFLVTTKRGENSPLVVNFGVQQGFQSAYRLPQFLESYDYARLFNEGRVNEGKTPFYTDQKLEEYKTGSDPVFSPNVNWYDQVVRKSAPMSNYNLNFKGGSNTVKYFVLLNAINSNGILINAGDQDDESINPRYRRFNFRSNVDINVTKRLSASLTLGGTVEDKSNPFANTTGGVFSQLAQVAPNAFPVYNPDGSFGGSAQFSNPLGNLLKTGSYTSNGRTLQSTLRLTEQLDFITQGLSLSGAVSFNNFFRSYSTKSKQYERFALSKDAVTGETKYAKFGQKTSLSGNESNSDQWRNIAFQSSLNYNRTFGKNAFQAVAIYNYDSYTESDNSTTAVGSLPFEHLSVGGRMTYAFNQKYVAEVSGSYMGSEIFAKANRFGFFPAASLGWIASNENFLKDNNLISFLKLRASYGIVGNDQIGGSRFAYEQRFPYGEQYFFGNNNINVFSISEGTAANPNLTWEKEKKINIGAEMTFAKRLNVAFDVFNQNRYDILATSSNVIPDFTGIILPLINQGKVSNKGIEASVRYSNNPDKKFKYFVEANAWYAKNKIDFQAEEGKLYAYQNTTGNQIGQPFGLEAIGLFKDAADVASSPKQTFAPVFAGDIKYKDQNGDGMIDQNDNVAIGNTNTPTLTFALNTGFEFKNFDLSFLFQGVSGNTVYLGGSQFHAFQNNGQIAPIALNRWTPETAATADYPRLTASNNLNNYRFSSFWQRDGSFIKLRNIELGYTLPKTWTNKVKFDNARIFVNGTNLFSLDYLKGYIDPETRSGHPALRTVSFGAKFQF
jgi:TonB-linked SusC/RagA family outer membrane protein